MKTLLTTSYGTYKYFQRSSHQLTFIVRLGLPIRVKRGCNQTD